MSDLSKLSNVELLMGSSSGDQKITLCDAEILSRMSSTEPEWRPIETAPKDGLPVLLGWFHKDVWIPMLCDWDEQVQVWYNYGTKSQYAANPTHWAPRPKGPLT